MNRQMVSTDKAPAAVGVHFQGGIGADFIFGSGQIAISQETGRLVGRSILEENRQALRNMAAILEATGSSLDEVVKTTVFLARIADFQSMKEVYKESFASAPLSRPTVGVSRPTVEDAYRLKR